MGKQTSLTKKDIEFIRNNYKHVSKTDIALQLNYNKSLVQQFCRKMGWVMSYKKLTKLRGSKNYKPFSPKDDDVIKKELSSSSIRKIAAKLNRNPACVSKRAKQLGLLDVIKRNAKRARFKQGHTPSNKGKKMSKQQYEKAKPTFFKKGHLPHNTVERDGVVRTRRISGHNTKPYKYIRISLGNWKLYHQYRWEMFRGKVPKGYCLWFKDGDTLNCRLSNLELISRAENVRRNRMSFLQYPPELRKTTILLNKLKKSINGKKQTK